jgi:hypothetical protein
MRHFYIGKELNQLTLDCSQNWLVETWTHIWYDTPIKEPKAPSVARMQPVMIRAKNTKSHQVATGSRRTWSTEWSEAACRTGGDGDTVCRSGFAADRREASEGRRRSAWGFCGSAGRRQSAWKLLPGATGPRICWCVATAPGGRVDGRSASPRAEPHGGFLQAPPPADPLVCRRRSGGWIDDEMASPRAKPRPSPFREDGLTTRWPHQGLNRVEDSCGHPRSLRRSKRERFMMEWLHQVATNGGWVLLGFRVW